MPGNQEVQHMASDKVRRNDGVRHDPGTPERDVHDVPSAGLSRRGLLTAGGAGVLAATFAPSALAAPRRAGLGAGSSPKARAAVKTDYPLALADQGYFFVGGNYVERGSGHIMADQMYVSYKVPRRGGRPYPIVMIHGGGQTGTNFDGTPDGREGWADFFVARGYTVYVVDQPARGRSAYHPDVDGPTNASTAETVEQRFTAPEDFNLWPQAHLHTQWPDGGRRGDPVFDQFYASQVESISNAALTQKINQDAGAALLDRIGPAVVLTHSQSGPFGWLIADARPELVKGIVAVEPSGPAFYDIVQVGPPNWFDVGPLSRPWGITSIPITYEPAVTDPSQLKIVREDKPDRPDLVRCWLQAEPARKLPRLAKIPIVMLTTEASYHASYDHCTSKYLRQAGVTHTYVRLEERGIRGNGHMAMLETNNLRIALLIERLIETRILSSAGRAARRTSKQSARDAAVMAAG
jgi:pimeloyl-ACP methyl ester carboxylesterase